MVNDIPYKYQRLVDLGLIDLSSEACKTAEAFTGTTLLILGGVGSGKTVAACWWLLRASEGLFVTAARLSRWPRYEDARMRELLRAPRLVIDDLGTEYMDEKGNFMAILDEVVADRSANERQTFLTSNLTSELFKARYGERIVDRIRESGMVFSLAETSKRHPQTIEEAIALRDALENEEERKAAAKEAVRNAPRLCARHIYGRGGERKCEPRCPWWAEGSQEGEA